jgi:hypothetical protein
MAMFRAYYLLRKKFNRNIDICWVDEIILILKNTFILDDKTILNIRNKILKIYKKSLNNIKLKKIINE